MNRDYFSELKRLKSFDGYLSSDTTLEFNNDLKQKYAMAGLYWTKEGEIIKCAFCHFLLIALRADDIDPVGLHYRFQSSCPLYTNNETDNQPTNKELLQKTFQRKPRYVKYKLFDNRMKQFDYFIKRDVIDKSLAQKLCYAGYYPIINRIDNKNPKKISIRCFCCCVEADTTEDLWKIVNNHAEKNIYCSFYEQLCTGQVEVNWINGRDPVEQESTSMIDHMESENQPVSTLEHMNWFVVIFCTILMSMLNRSRLLAPGSSNDTVNETVNSQMTSDQETDTQPYSDAEGNPNWINHTTQINSKPIVDSEISSHTLEHNLLDSEIGETDDSISRISDTRDDEISMNDFYFARSSNRLSYSENVSHLYGSSRIRQKRVSLSAELKSDQQEQSYQMTTGIETITNSNDTIAAPRSTSSSKKSVCTLL